MGYELLEEVRTDLHLADASLRLRVLDAEVRAARRVQPKVADAHIAELTDADPGPAEGRDDRPPADVGRRASIRRAMASIVWAYSRIASRAPSSPQPAMYGIDSPLTSSPTDAQTT